MNQFMNFFKDKNGRVVIFQFPNLPLLAWILFTILNLLLGSKYPKLQHLFSMLSFGFIFTWAWLEISSGVNYFRRALGLLVLVIIIFF